MLWLLNTISVILFMDNWSTARLLEVPTFEDDYTKFVKQKCQNKDSKKLEMLPLEVNKCLENHINYTQVQLELEESKKTGSMDVVFIKYCKKYPEIYTCLSNAAEKLKFCLDEKEQRIFKQVLNFVHVLKEYICFKDGMRLALFIYQDGIECMDSQMGELQMCFNQTVGVRMEDLLLQSFPEVEFTEKQCDKLSNIRKCFYKELVKCEKSIPSNVSEAFFKFLEKYFLCKNKEVQDTNDLMYRIIFIVIFFLVILAVCYKLAT